MAILASNLEIFFVLQRRVMLKTRYKFNWNDSLTDLQMILLATNTRILFDMYFTLGQIYFFKV